MDTPRRPRKPSLFAQTGGRINARRASRRAPWALLSMSVLLIELKNILHPEEAAKRPSRRTRHAEPPDRQVLHTPLGRHQTSRVLRGAEAVSKGRPLSIKSGFDCIVKILIRACPRVGYLVTMPLRPFSGPCTGLLYGAHNVSGCRMLRGVHQVAAVYGKHSIAAPRP